MMSYPRLLKTAFFAAGFLGFMSLYIAGRQSAIDDPQQRLAVLPSLTTRLQDGTPMALSSLKGEPLVVILADSKSPQELAFAQTSARLSVKVSERKPQRVLIITDKPSMISREGLGPTILFSAPDEYSSLKQEFELQKGLSKWIVYDAQGSMRGAGQTGSDTISYFIETAVGGGRELSSAAILDSTRGTLRPQQLAKYLGKRSKRTVIVFLSKMCSVCGEFSVIANLSARSKESDTEVSIVLVDGLTEEEGRVILHNYDLPFEIHKADITTEGWWKDLARRYSSVAANACAVKVVDGQIVDAAPSNEVARLFTVDRGDKQ